MQKITTILLLVAVLLSAAMAIRNEDEARPDGFYLRGEDEKDLLEEVSALARLQSIQAHDCDSHTFLLSILVASAGVGGRRRVLVASACFGIVLHVHVDVIERLRITPHSVSLCVMTSIGIGLY